MTQPHLSCVPADAASSELASSRELDAARDQLSSRLNHTFSNPLNIIIGFADLLMSSDLSEEQRQDAREIADAARRLSALAVDALQAPRLWAPATSSAISPKRLCDLVADALGYLHIEEDDRLVTWCIDAREMVRTDPARITRALAETVAAFLRHRTDGAQAVVGSARADDSIALVITRVGGAPVDRDVLLEPFESCGRINLGLACARAMVRSVGGRLTLSETPSFGHQATIVLPQRIGREAETS